MFIHRFWIALIFVGAIAVAPVAVRAAPTAVILSIDGPIGPAIGGYIDRGFAEARAREARVIILRMDTPGGLSSSMRDIIKNILASPIPVLTYVSPGGARAASAGTYILYASHIAAMAPGTNLGAATPVQIGGGGLPAPAPAAEKPQGDGDGDGETTSKPHPTLKDKILNDSIAYIKSLAELRKRNVAWAEEAVAEAASLTAEEALKRGVIDMVVPSIADLLARADGRMVMVGDREQKLMTAGLATEEIEPDWRTEFLAVITDPNIAYILMLVAVYGLFLEFTHPGIILPGVIGGTCLLLALYAFQMLPINFAGLALMALGFALIIAEAFAPSFGVLGIGGIVALVFGSIMLIDTDMPGFGISPLLIGSVALASGLLFMALAGFAVRARQRPVVSGAEAMIGITGEVVHWQGRRGRVRVHGEMWAAEGPEGLKSGRKITVAARDRLSLTVTAEND